MKRFSDQYTKPDLLSINDGFNLGWSADCPFGTNASTSCGGGAGVTKTGIDGFINPETLNQTERRSNLLTD